MPQRNEKSLQHRNPAPAGKGAKPGKVKGKGMGDPRELKRQDGKENLATFRCSAEYSLIYKVQANLTCSDACAMLFAEKNAVFNAWPFFRELCFSQAGKSGLPHVMLPLFRLPINNP